MPKIIADAKRNIMTTTKQLLFDCGYADMTLRGVAKDCGIAVGTIYNYFSGKEDLVGSIMAEDWMWTRESMQAECEQAQSITFGIKAIYDSIVHFAGLYEPVWSDYASSGRMPDRYDERHLMLRHQIGEVLRSLLYRFERAADESLVPLMSEMILCTAVQKDINYQDLTEIVNRVFV